MEVQGRIKLIGTTETVGNNGFRKRDIVITTEEQYPQHISVQFIQDKCSLLDMYELGQEVKISINLRGREWVSPQGETKYFNTIQGWRIENLQTQAPVAQQPAPGMGVAPTTNVEDAFEPVKNINNVEEDDLPF